MIFFSFKTHPELEKAVMKKIDAKAGDFIDKTFANGEYYLKLKNEVKGKRAIILAAITEPREQLMKLLFLINALKSNKASRVIICLPYFPYSRQDRVTEPGEPISAELVLNLIIAAGANKIITLDIHNRRGLGKQRKYLKNIETAELVAEHVKKSLDTSWVVAAPDFGAKDRVNEIAKLLKIKSVAYLKKTRPQPGEAKILDIEGSPVKDKKVIIIDDMIDTGGTLIEAANFLRARGARQVMAACTHGIFSRDALKNINQSVIMKVWATDSLPLSTSSGKLSVVSCAETLARAIMKYA